MPCNATPITINPAMSRLKWLLLLTQIPASASSARVALWRRLKAAGATSVEHGAWMLPATEAHKTLLNDLAQNVQAQGGSASLFEATAVADDKEMIARFIGDRKREYQEFETRSQGLLDEVAKEIAAKKFTFAELEEVEDDLKKLEVWLGKIAARDFFAGDALSIAQQRLCACAFAVENFAANVYAADGIEE
jgi:DNA-binding transcriptional regulator PaaX